MSSPDHLTTINRGIQGVEEVYISTPEILDCDSFR